jgi:hypothetical protein
MPARLIFKFDYFGVPPCLIANHYRAFCWTDYVAQIRCTPGIVISRVGNYLYLLYNKDSNNSMNKEHQILVHTAKAIGYRFEKVVRNSKENFGEFRIAEHARSPREIVNHMCDLVTKTRTMISERHFNCSAPTPLSFQEEKYRFLTALRELQEIIPQFELDEKMVLRLLQGPMIDMATHIGQIAMLNGLHGNKIPGENYFAVDL